MSTPARLMLPEVDRVEILTVLDLSLDLRRALAFIRGDAASQVKWWESRWAWALGPDRS
jgi:hypothetical protein